MHISIIVIMNHLCYNDPLIYLAPLQDYTSWANSTVPATQQAQEECLINKWVY